MEMAFQSSLSFSFLIHTLLRNLKRNFWSDFGWFPRRAVNFGYQEMNFVDTACARQVIVMFIKQRQIDFSLCLLCAGSGMFGGFYPMSLIRTFLFAFERSPITDSKLETRNWHSMCAFWLREPEERCCYRKFRSLWARNGCKWPSEEWKVLSEVIGR